jgi:hypothetical protein
MGYRIERLSFGGILDQSFRLVRDHFVPMVSVFAAMLVPYTMAAQALGWFGPADSPGILAASLALFLILMLVMPLAQLMLNAMILDAYLGAPSDWRSALQRGRSSYASYLQTSFLMTLALLALALLLVLPAVYFAVCWILIGPIAMLEQVSGRAALSRSRALVTGYFWRVVGVLLIIMLVGIAQTVIAGMLTEVPVLGALISGGLQAVMSTFTSAVLVVLYIDLRCRHESFDVRLLADQVARGTSAPPPMATAAVRSSDAPSA